MDTPNEKEIKYEIEKLSVDIYNKLSYCFPDNNPRDAKAEEVRVEYFEELVLQLEQSIDRLLCLVETVYTERPVTHIYEAQIDALTKCVEDYSVQESIKFLANSLHIYMKDWSWMYAHSFRFLWVDICLRTLFKNKLNWGNILK